MATADDFHASISARFLALAIDVAVFVSLSVPLAVFCRELAGPDAYAAPWFFLVAFSLIYWVGFAYRWDTLGKWFVGLRVIDQQGRPPSFAQCLKRSFYPGNVWVGALLIVTGSTGIVGESRIDVDLLLGYLWISPYLWLLTGKVDKSTRTTDFFNDRLSGTHVVRRPGYTWLLNWAEFVIRQIPGALQTAVSRRVRWVIETFAPLWLDLRRLGAWIIDLMILRIVYRWLDGRAEIFEQADSWYFVFLIVAALILWIAPSYGCGPGKALTNVRIVNARGDPPGLLAGFVRAVVPGTLWIAFLMIAPQWELIPAWNWLSGAFALAFVVSLFLAIVSFMLYLTDPFQRGLGDLVAGTYVVDAGKRFGVSGYPQPLPDDFPWQVRPAARKPPAPEGDEPEAASGIGARRTIGLIIDLLVVVVGWIVIESFFPGYRYIDLRVLLFAVLLIGYFVGLVAFGTTLGSWLTGVRIVSARRGVPPGFARAAVRMLPYAPLIVLPAFDTSRVAYSFEASQLVKMAADLVWLALLVVIVLDLVTLKIRDEPMHNQISGTTVERSDPSSQRGILGTRIVEKWRWLNGVEPEPTLTLIRPRRRSVHL